MCAAKKGHTVSQETRDKIGAAHRQENHYVLCPCGNNIRVTKHQLKRGRKKYCSKDCKHKFFSRRSTGKYTKRKINTGWFKKGNNPWNDGLVGVMPTPPN